MVAVYRHKHIEAMRADNGGWIVKGEWFATEREALQRLATAAYGESWPTSLVLNSSTEGEWWATSRDCWDGIVGTGPHATPAEAADALAAMLDKQGS